MFENFGRSRFLRNEQFKPKKLGSVSEERYKFEQIIIDSSKSKLIRLLAGLVATIGIGRIGTDRLDLHISQTDKEDRNSLEQIEPVEGGFKEFQRHLEAMKTVRDILLTESLYTYYQGTSEEEEFKRLVTEEEIRQQRANTRGSEDLDVLEKAYANGLRNLDYLFQVADQMGVPRGILMGIALEESGFNKNAKNKTSSAKSEMQILDATAKSWSKKFAIQIDKWIREMEAYGTDRNPEHKVEYQKLKELQTRLKKGEDLRQEDGLYLGAFGLRTLLRNREDEALGVLAYKIGNNGVAQEVAKSRRSGKKGTFIEVRPNLQKADDQQYVIRVQAELNLFIKVLDHIIERIEAQGNSAFNEQSGQDIFYDPKES